MDDRIENGVYRIANDDMHLFAKLPKTLEKAQEMLDDMLDLLGLAGFSIRPNGDVITIHLPEYKDKDFIITGFITCEGRNYENGMIGMTRHDDLINWPEDERLHKNWRFENDT